MVALASTESRAWVEHWLVGVCNGTESVEVVQGIAVTPQVFVPSGFAVSWHPTLQKELMYAMAMGSQTVYLINGRRHRVVYAWTFHENTPFNRSLPDDEHDQTMKWSPDGIRLAITGRNSIFVMQADTIANDVMFQAPHSHFRGR